MNFAKFAKMTVAVAFLIASMGQPMLAHAEGGENKGEWPWQVGLVDAAVISTTTAAADDVWVDGKIITAESYGSGSASSDPEWRYVPVRRTNTTNAFDGATAEEGGRGNGGGGDIIVFDIVG